MAFKACPNRNNKDWITLVDKVGIFEAYRQFNDLGYQVPHFLFQTNEDVDVYLRSLPQIRKKGDKYYVTTGGSYEQYLINTHAIRKEVNRINEVYNGLLNNEVEEITTPSKFNTGRSKAVYITINSNALKEHYDVYKELKQEGQYREEGGEILPLYEQRINDKLAPEEWNDYLRKKEILLKNFPFVKEVIEDYNIPQAGLVEPGGNIIRVNPLYWTRDTIGHEFAHVMIDAIGGLSNPLVQRGIALLKGSPLELRVREQYKDLYEKDKDRYWKEVLAQAIGEKSINIFERESSQNAFRRWLSAFLERVRQILGIEPNAVRELARRLVNDPIESKGDNIISFSEQRSQGRDEELRERIEKIENEKGKVHKTKIQEYRDEAIRILENKITRYQKSDEKARMDRLTDIHEKILEVSEDPVESLRLFNQFAIDETNRIYEEHLAAKDIRNNLSEHGNDDPDNEAYIRNHGYTVRRLSRWKEYLAGFDLLEEMIMYAEDIQTDLKRRISGEEAKKLLDLPKLEEAVRRKNVVERVYIDEGRRLIASFLAPHSRHIEAEFRERAEREYNKLPKTKRMEQSLDEFIEDYLEVNANNIKELSTELIWSDLAEASRDISQIERWIDNILDSPDAVVSAMASAYSQAAFKARKRILEVQHTIVEKLRNYEKFQRKGAGIFGNSSDFYSLLLETDKKGRRTGNLIDVYKSDMWEEYNSLRRRLEAQGLDKDTVRAELTEWKRYNAPLDWEKFSKVKNKFLADLVKQGVLTKQEKKLLDQNDESWLEEKKRIDEILTTNDTAIQVITEWMRDNVWKYRTPRQEWHNEKWYELVKAASGKSSVPIDVDEQIGLVEENAANDPRVDFYNFITQTTKKLQSKIPYAHRIHFRLPGILKDSEERLKSNNFGDAINNAFNRNFKVLIDESERGMQWKLTDEANNPVYFIPVHFTRNLYQEYRAEFDELDYKKQKPILDKYKGEYDDLSALQKEAMSLADYAKNEYARDKADKEQSYDLAGIYFNFFRSAITFAEKFEILPQMEMARYFVNHRNVSERDDKGNLLKNIFGKNKSKPREEQNVPKPKNNIAISNQLNDWFEAVMYGIYEKKEGNINFFGLNLDTTKTLDTINRYTALNMLGVNFVQGTANVLLGTTMQWFEAAGGQFYSPKDYVKAVGVYWKNFGGILGDIGQRYPKNKVSLLNELFDILNEYEGGKFREKSKFRRLLHSKTLFFTSQAGEHFMQTKVMLAMLNKVKAKDANGNILGNMLDMVKVKDNHLVFENKEGISVSNFGIEEQRRFGERVKRVLSSLHGEYSTEGRIALQKYALGRMAYMFRKFVVSGARRRFGKKRVNNFLGEYVEGNYRTFGRFVANLMKDLFTLKWALMSNDWKSMTNMEKRNVRKTLAEGTFLAAAIILSYSMMENKGDDDDDENKDFSSFLAYQILRYRTELAFYVHPGQAMQILRSPAASISVAENLIKLFGQLVYPLYSGELQFDMYEQGSWKGRPKIVKTATNLVPGYKQYFRLKYMQDLANWMR